LLGDAGSNPVRGNGSLSLVSVVCCHVEVSATDRSLDQRSLTDCGVSECYREASIMRSPGLLAAVAPWRGGGNLSYSLGFNYIAVHSR